MKISTPTSILTLPVRAARKLLRGARRLVDAALHPSRRRRALEDVEARSADVESILFICLGNVCRSPYAEFRYRATMSEREGDAGPGRDPEFSVDSAGFIGPGRQPPEHALAAADRRGLDMREHRSKVMEDVELERFDLVVVMDRTQQEKLARMVGESKVVLLGDLDPEWGTLRAIRDPWGHPPHVFDDVYDRIDRCLAALHGALRATG